MKCCVNFYIILAHTVPRNPDEYNGFPEYLVKWEGLPYSECTWEDGKLIADKFHTAIENYNLRQKSQKIPSKICKVCISERTIRRMSRRSSLEMAICVYSHFETIDYYIRIQKNKEWAVFRSFYIK